VSDRPHIRLSDPAVAVTYTYPGEVSGGRFQTPPRDRVPHAAKLRAEIIAATGEFEKLQAQPGAEQTSGLTLFLQSDPEYELKLSGLDRRRDGIELLSVGIDAEAMTATIFVPHASLSKFLKLLDEYETQLDSRSGRPRNEALVQSIALARLAITEDFWQDSTRFPDEDEAINWEVWLRSTEGHASTVHTQFLEHCGSVEMRANPHFVAFPDRVVTMAYGTRRQISRSLGLMTSIAELRRAKELATEYLRVPGRFQREIIDDFLERVAFPSEDVPAVLLLDTGVHAGHPLIDPALSPSDRHSVEQSWGTGDDERQHGTGMAGVALYGDLTVALASNQTVELRHRLESAKILPPPPGANQPELYGYITEQGVARAMIAAPERNRVICMAVTTDDRDAGRPSSWSGAIDQMCAGVSDREPKLMLVSAGNIDDVQGHNAEYSYPRTNCEEAGVEDPGQAWNVLTVGAYTEKVLIEDPDLWRFRPVAQSGDLCPTSRTSLAWGEENFGGWPIKPDLVMEGGNYVTDGTVIDGADDLSLLSTALTPDGRLLQAVSDTSPATALAARLAASIWSAYPDMWPETIRALMVHSANWTDAMMARFRGNTKAAAEERLRAYGYGVPNVIRAHHSAENAVTLIFEGEIQPYRLERSSGRTNVMHLHRLPWPRDVLLDLGETEVTMKVTLSYFVEPSPGRRGWSTSTSHRYQSHGLRFDVIRLNEDEQAFRQRLTRAEWESEERPESVGETRNWVVGSQGRSHGSLHSDWWRGLASDLAACDRLAVFPVTGWWKERPHKRRVESTSRYSLIISLETSAQDVDLYTPIANQIAVESQVET
jgi:hypothetical protein